jgi:hypothetical protein
VAASKTERERERERERGRERVREREREREGGTYTERRTTQTTLAPKFIHFRKKIIV